VSTRILITGGTGLLGQALLSSLPPQVTSIQLCRCVLALEVLDWRPKTSFDHGLSVFVDWVKRQAGSPDLSDQAIGEMREKALHKSARLAQKLDSDYEK
jgi:nucleoside-diphosphate-sugar epimerase